MLPHTYVPISKTHDKYHRLSVMFNITANKKGKIAKIQNAFANYFLWKHRYPETNNILTGLWILELQDPQIKADSIFGP